MSHLYHDALTVNRRGCFPTHAKIQVFRAHMLLVQHLKPARVTAIYVEREEKGYEGHAAIPALS